jgi:two-component system, sensor histidine kinase and response regulator
MIKKLSGGFSLFTVAMACALVLAGLIAYRNVTGFVQSTRWVRHTYEVLNGLETTKSLLKDAETGQRGYIITGDPKYLERYSGSAGKVAPTLDRLLTLTQDNPSQQARLRAFRGATRAKLSELAEVIELRRNQGFDVARGRVRTDRGETLMVEALRISDEIARAERALLEERDERSDANFRRSAGMLSAVAALALSLFFCLWTVFREVRNRRRAEQEMRRSIEQFQALTEAIPQLIWSTGPDGTPLYWNPQWFVYTGISGVEELNDRWRSLQHPDDLARVDLFWRQALETGESQAIETRIRRHDGAFHWFQMQVVSVRNAEGQVSRWIGACTDIDEEKRIAVDRALLATIVDSSQDAVIGKDLDGLITSWNAGAERLFGYSAGEVLGRSVSILMPPDRSHEEEDIDARLLRGERMAHFESVRQAKGGRLIEVSLSISPIKDEAGRIIGFSKIASDITDRKRSEEALRRSEEKFRGIVEAANEGIWVLNEDARIDFVNTRMAEMLGYDPPEIVGRPKWEFLFEEDREKVAELFERRRQHGFRDQADIRFRRRDGGIFWTLMAAAPILDEAETFVGSLELFTDITERKHSEEQIHRLNEVLEAARDAAEAATRAKGDFLANMSHEIRTPMNGVVGMTGLLLDTQLNDLQRGFAETIRNSGEALLTVINDILDFSKIEAGKLRLEMTDFDLRTLLEEVTDLLAPRAQEKGLAICCRVDQAVPPRLKGDPVRIRQVLTNMAGNAVKFTDRGDVSLDARVLSRDEAGITLRVLVRDTGIGIPKEQQADVFESFTQIEGGKSRRYGGTGLGLTICRSLIGMMGGKLDLESAPGEGSTFWFDLTLARAEGTADVPDINLDGLRVLIIDDHETHRKLISEVLLTWGCRPEVAESGTEGFARLLATTEADPFGLILLDQGMPGLDGVQPAKVMKAVERFAGVPIVLLTSLGSPESSLCFEDGLFVGKLTKPIGRSKLHNVLLLAAAPPGSPRVQPQVFDTGEANTPLNLRVLLAEDNEVNQRVAIGMVERLGCRIDSVQNGREAMETLDYDLHDLILMDVQMPEMDGLSAAAAIRERERETGKHIPIIALTAHAMQGDRERCLAAGMDGYLSKPLRAGPLRAALHDWGVEDGPPPPEAATTQPPGGRSLFAESLAESCGNDPRLISEVVGLMLKGTPKRLERLEAALTAGDGRQVSWEAHGLKGAFLTVGAEILAGACEELMALGNLGDFKAMDGVCHHIRDEWERLREEATRYVESLAIPGPGTA